MTTWGGIIFIGFTFAYWLIKDRGSNLGRFCLWGSGIGAGMVIAGIWVAVAMYQTGLF